MAKKSFSAANTGRVFNIIEEATAVDSAVTKESIEAEQAYTEVEAEQYKAAGKTQGRKGLKAARINMAFTPDNHAYITTMARIKGQSITQFVNAIIEADRAQNAAVYEQAKQFINL